MLHTNSFWHVPVMCDVGLQVRRALLLCVPWAQVYAIGHCGFVVLQRRITAEDGDNEGWQLCACSDVHYHTYDSSS